MNIDRQTIKHYLSQLTPSELSALAAELRSDWRLPEPMASVPVRPPKAPRVAGHAVVLVGFGPSRVATIRALRAEVGIDLRAARALVETLPVVVQQASTRSAAEDLATTLREAGATVDVNDVLEG